MKKAFGTALIYDLGLFPWLGPVLAQQFKTVYYFSPYQDAWPVSRKSMYGLGLPGVQRVNDFYDFVDEADLIVFPDVGAGDLQMFLRRQGYPVWGAGASEMLELDRVELKRVLKANGMDVPRTWFPEGMDALRAHLEDPAHEDEFIKISEYRGEGEKTRRRAPSQC